MKTLLLVAGGRGGSDFFQGLLDGHTQILSFPLYLKIDDNFIEMLNEENPEKLEASYGNLLPVLVKAVQELSEELETQKKEIAKLRMENKKMSMARPASAGLGDE